VNFNYMEYLPEQQNLIPFGLALLLVGCIWAFYKLLHYRLVKSLTFIAQKFTQMWGTTLLDQRVVEKFVLAIPVLAFMFGIQLIPNLPDILTTAVTRICLSLVLILALRAISKFFDNVNTAYSELEISNNRPIKGFIQVFLILVHLLIIILVISILIDKSPWIFVSGLGAMTAVLLLVFRDTLLSLVAGLQLTANNYARVGDWIEMPHFGADGNVIDIALHAIRIQNWDKTISVIPTHKFLEYSFINWRGMQEIGGRRIRRAIHIDTNSIKFLSLEEAKDLKRFELIKGYLNGKLTEIEQQGSKAPENSRRLTNLGTFRAYIASYLRAHPNIRQDLTFIVRQLAPSPEGVPLEIYVFVNNTDWPIFEGIQSDIFEHIMTITPEFGLKIYQKPSGADFKNLRT